MISISKSRREITKKLLYVLSKLYFTLQYCFRTCNVFPIWKVHKILILISFWIFPERQKNSFQISHGCDIYFHTIWMILVLLFSTYPLLIGRIISNYIDTLVVDMRKFIRWTWNNLLKVFFYLSKGFPNKNAMFLNVNKTLKN